MISDSEFINDFSFRCRDVVIREGDLVKVRNSILEKGCPFLGMFDRNEMRPARRYYKRYLNNGLQNKMLEILREVENELQR